MVEESTRNQGGSDWEPLPEDRNADGARAWAGNQARQEAFVLLCPVSVSGGGGHERGNHGANATGTGSAGDSQRHLPDDGEGKGGGGGGLSQEEWAEFEAGADEGTPAMDKLWHATMRSLGMVHYGVRVPLAHEPEVLPRGGRGE